MARGIASAAKALLPALDPGMLDGDGLVDGRALRAATVTVDQLLRTRRGPTAAIYITWDVRGTCRYVGSARRPTSQAAVRGRLQEHMAIDGRRDRWYAITVLPIRPRLGIDLVRECEGIIARRLRPVEGSTHPVPSTERPLREVLAQQLVAAD